MGAVLGAVLLHPATMAIYWLEFRADLASTWSSPWQLIAERMTASFGPAMLAMTALFAGLGAVVGSVYAILDARLRRSERAISHLEHEMARDVPTLIQLGEGEHVEPASAPVFFDDGAQTRLFVRTGNASREFDARETLEYVAARWNAGRGAATTNRPPLQEERSPRIRHPPGRTPGLEPSGGHDQAC